MWSYKNIFITYHFIVYISFFYCISHILMPRSFIKTPLLSCCLFLIFSSGYEIYTGDVRSLTRYILCLLSFLLPVLIFFKDKITRKLFALIFTFFLPAISESICGGLIWPILHSLLKVPYSPEIIVPQDEPFFLFIYLLPMGLTEVIVTLKGPKIWGLLHLNFNAKILVELALCPLLLASGILELLKSASILLQILLYFLFILGNLFFIKGISDLVLNMKSARNNLKIKKKLELLLFNYDVIEQQSLSIRLQNHDIANHLRTVEYLISENQVDEAKDYLKKFCREK